MRPKPPTPPPNVKMREPINWGVILAGVAGGLLALGFLALLSGGLL